MSSEAVVRRRGKLSGELAELVRVTVAHEFGEARALEVLAALKASWSLLDYGSGTGERERFSAAAIVAGILTAERERRDRPLLRVVLEDEEER